MPQLSESEWSALLSNNAPIFEIETRGEFDRIGEMRFDENEKIVFIEAIISDFLLPFSSKHKQ